MKKSILVVLLILAIAAFAVYFYTFRESEKTVASQEAAFSLSVEELVKEFETDENAANQKYLDKVVRVNGIVNNISETENEVSVILKDAESTAGVTCSFDKESFDESRVKQGQKVSVKGICTGFLMDVVLNRCALDVDTPK